MYPSRSTLDGSSSQVLDGSSSSGKSLKYEWSCSNDDGLHEVLQKVGERRVVLLPDQLQKTDFSYRSILLVLTVLMQELSFASSSV